MPTTTDLIGLAIDQKPVDFAAAFDEILQQKAADALEAHKVELANSIYGGPETSDDDDIGDEDDFDFSEDEFDDDEDAGDDDLDLDLDDLDLDLDDLDLDLEDITDDE